MVRTSWPCIDSLFPFTFVFKQRQSWSFLLSLSLYPLSCSLLLLLPCFLFKNISATKLNTFPLHLSNPSVQCSWKKINIVQMNQKELLTFHFLRNFLRFFSRALLTISLAFFFLFIPLQLPFKDLFCSLSWLAYKHTYCTSIFHIHCCAKIHLAS